MSLPVLRFKDSTGKSFPAWSSLKLAQLTKIYDGTHMTPDYKESGIPFYSVEHLTSNNFSDTKFIAEGVYDKENKRVKLEKGDILMTRIGDIGTPKYIDWDVKASFYVSLALIKQSKSVSSQYLAHFINSSFFQKELHRRTIHVAFPKKINLGEIGECLVSLPEKEEQTKIAKFLTAVDEKITQLTQKYELLAQYKKGVMQQIFSQELRFKDDDGQDFAEWKSCELGSVSDVRDGTHDSPSYHSQGYPFITSKNLLVNGEIDLQNVNFISEADFININKRSKVDTGDILFGMIGTIGNPVLVKSSKFAIKNVALIKKTGKLSNEFLVQYLKSNVVMKQFDDLAVGNTQKFIALGKLRQLNIQLPSTKEQTRIANFLTAIDDKLTHTQNQLAAAKQYKQGLLQQMFV